MGRNEEKLLANYEALKAWAYCLNSITISDGVWVATGSTILQGVTLNDMTVVAAGSVVVKSTEANDVVGGNPSKFIKKRIIENNE